MELYHYSLFIKHMGAIPKLDDNTLQAICDVLGDTAAGLSGSEIGKVLSQAGVIDVDPANTKRYRLFSALRTRQEQDGCSNNVFAFVEAAMDPIRYAQNIEVFYDRRKSLNVVFALRGYNLLENGKMIAAEQAKTLSEAQRRAHKLQKVLQDRNVHYQVLLYCRAELLEDNYFHAVFEATKSVAERIRQLSGLSEDGAELVDAAFSIKRPILALNTLRSETERSEQTGFAHLVKGIFGMFRNVPVHAPKIKWPIAEGDAYDLLTLVSFVHRKLDNAAKTGL